MDLQIVGKITSNFNTDHGNNFNVQWTDTRPLRKGAVLIVINVEDLAGKNCSTCKHQYDNEMDCFPCGDCGENGDLSGWYKNWEHTND